MSKPVPLCQGLKSDGTSCGSPALRGRPLCYYHNRRAMNYTIPRDHAVYTIPKLNSARNIQKATENLLRQFHEHRFTDRQFATMLRSLRLAHDVLHQLQKNERRSQ